MIKGLMSLILIIFFLNGISAFCNETQIDINTANLTELDKITGIGPAYAQRIIQGRGFSSVDDLIRVSGIGNKTLDKIKLEGLACVSEETQDTENNSENDTEMIDNKTETADNNSNKEQINNLTTPVPTEKKIKEEGGTYIPKSKIETINLSPISLNSKSIKSENNKDVLNKNLALSGIITFSIMFGGLFLLKQARRKKENEFR